VAAVGVGGGAGHSITLAHLESVEGCEVMLRTGQVACAKSIGEMILALEGDAMVLLQSWSWLW